ncbi:MAG TPA: hypothetical protein VI522_02495, partial [Gammaproteobacteria bacterium]|nr:hypothetical protein [Gammaproteobacteria bacterium]
GDFLIVSNGVNDTVSVCTITPFDCSVFSAFGIDEPRGRIAQSILADTTVYLPNYGNNTVLLCGEFGCFSDFDPSFSNPLGAFDNFATSYTYIPNLNNTVSMCKIEGGILNLCRVSEGLDGSDVPTFDFSADTAVNLFLNFNGVDGYAYVPNEAIDTISVCPLDRVNGQIGECGIKTGIDNPSSVWITNPARAEAQFLYVGNDDASFGEPWIEVFSLSDLSTAIVTVPAPDAGGNHAVGFAIDGDAERLYVADTLNDEVSVFDLSLNPITSFAANCASGIAIDSGGNIYVSNSCLGEINVYDSSYTNTMTLDGPVSYEPYQLAFDGFDSSAHLIAADHIGNLKVYNPPFSNGQTPDTSVAIPAGASVWGVAYKALTNQLLVSEDGTRIYTYDLPLTGASVPTATDIFAGKNWGPGLAFDAAQNLYVGDYGNSAFDTIAPPYTTAVPYGLDFASPGGVIVH